MEREAVDPKPRQQPRACIEDPTGIHVYKQPGKSAERRARASRRPPCRGYTYLPLTFLPCTTPSDARALHADPDGAGARPTGGSRPHNPRRVLSIRTPQSREITSSKHTWEPCPFQASEKQKVFKAEATPITQFSVATCAQGPRAPKTADLQRSSAGVLRASVIHQTGGTPNLCFAPGSAHPTTRP